MGEALASHSMRKYLIGSALACLLPKPVRTSEGQDRGSLSPGAIVLDAAQITPNFKLTLCYMQLTFNVIYFFAQWCFAKCEELVSLSGLPLLTSCHIPQGKEKYKKWPYL